MGVYQIFQVATYKATHIILGAIVVLKMWEKNTLCIQCVGFHDGGVVPQRLLGRLHLPRSPELSPISSQLAKFVFATISERLSSDLRHFFLPTGPINTWIRGSRYIVFTSRMSHITSQVTPRITQLEFGHGIPNKAPTFLPLPPVDHERQSKRDGHCLWEY